ncbi:MAG: hypothetical protein K8T25_10020 [Planctomycetia bacterium]|nr:hypothetical protein [Planctomycetia bacterium]
MDRWPEKGGLPLLIPFANITRAVLVPTNAAMEDADLIPLTVRYNTDATQISILPPSDNKPHSREARIRLETAEKSEQMPDGRITLTALDAKVHGLRAKLETHPGNHRIGFWSDPNEFVTWNYTATRPGRYEVYLTYSTASEDGTQVRVEIGDQKLDATLKKTEGGWYGYTWLNLGKVSIAKEGPLTVTVRCIKKVGDAVMNLKAITLLPTCEGTPPVQAEDGTVTLHARDVTIQGTKVRWEPKPEKNTVGYWTQPTDTVSWNFTLKQSGKYDIEVLQGCGKGQGGSDVAVFGLSEPLRFKVQDTGHFQNFVPRVVGTVNLEAGPHSLRVEPYHKAAAAVMDLRQVRLFPHASEKPAK